MTTARNLENLLVEAEENIESDTEWAYQMLNEISVQFAELEEEYSKSKVIFKGTALP